MTNVLFSSHTEKLGVTEVQRVSARARTIFRPTSIDDIGIDGFWEFLENGVSTGMIAGVQIKSGNSFVDETGKRFTFRSDKEHFGYWARCCFPVIGIVFSPDHQNSVWFDLTSLSTDDRIVNGPYSITLEYSSKTAFTPENLVSQIKSIIHKYSYQRRTLWQIQELMHPREEKASLKVPSIGVSSEREEAWFELMGIFFDLDSVDEEAADAAYRLSWYLPSVSEKLQQEFKARLEHLDDLLLVRTIRIMSNFLENNAVPATELVADLLRYIPEVTNRIEHLLKEHKIPSVNAEIAIQTVELLEQKHRADLRSLFS